MSTLRCFARIPGIPESVPMKVEENGWPTFPGRSRPMQADVLARDGAAPSTTSAAPTTSPTTAGSTCATATPRRPSRSSTSGCSTARTCEKPAFAVYRRLVRPPGPRASRRRRGGGRELALRVRGRRGFDARGRTLPRRAVQGEDRRHRPRAWSAARASASASRRFRLDRRAPFSRVVHRPRRRGSHRHMARAAVRLRDGRLVRLRRAFRACR